MTAGPYASAYDPYRRAGWTGVLPLPARRKKNPPSGYTGGGGAWPSYADCAAWADGPEGAGNIALRMPPGVIGVDVDAYDGKPGARTLADAEQRWGPLPATSTSSARGPGPSGIRLYRVPENLAWPGEVGPAVEIIQARHRYAVVWPSYNPDADALYQWYRPDGSLADGPPDVDSLPQLPDAWITGLTGGAEAVDTPRNDWTSQQVQAWLLTRPRALEDPCPRLARALDAALLALAAGASAHNTTTGAVMRVVRLADEGHAGAVPTLTRLHETFTSAVTNPGRPGATRTPAEAEHEWRRSLEGAVTKVSATTTGLDACDCDGRITDAIVAAAGNPHPGEQAHHDPTLSQQETVPQPNPTQPDPTQFDPARDAYIEDQIRAETLKIQIREEARRRARKAQHGTQQAPPPVLLTDFLAVPDDPVQYRIEGLWPVGGRVMLTAQFKSGKTTLVGNLVRSLVDSEAFLDRFLTHRPRGRVGIIDDELDDRMLRRWLRDQNITNTSDAVVVPLRGRVSTFDLLDDQTRAEWAATIQAAGITVLIVDCLAPILDALGLSEDKEAGQFLVALDELAKIAGVDEIVLVHHMGHTSERARGASRLRDWPDVEWRLVREKEDGEDNPAARRYFSAYGRDVDIAESALEYNAATRRLALVGGARKDAVDDELRDSILDHLRRYPGASQQEVMAAGPGGQKKRKAALEKLVTQGLVTQIKDPRNGAKRHSVAPPPSATLGNHPADRKTQVNTHSAESVGNARQSVGKNGGEALGNPAPLRGGAGALPSSATSATGPPLASGTVIIDGRLINTSTGEDLGPAAPGSTT